MMRAGGQRAVFTHRSEIAAEIQARFIVAGL